MRLITKKSGEVVKDWSLWFGWKYIGIMALAFSAPALPWIMFQFLDNMHTGRFFFLLNWNHQPELHNHKQIIMHQLAINFKQTFEFAMECIEKQHN